MWSLVDTIQASIAPVYTINMGLAASTAVIIFLAGHNFILSRTRITPMMFYDLDLTCICS